MATITETQQTRSATNPPFNDKQLRDEKGYVYKHHDAGEPLRATRVGRATRWWGSARAVRGARASTVGQSGARRRPAPPVS
jgi:hypothetical protein